MDKFDLGQSETLGCTPTSISRYFGGEATIKKRISRAFVEKYVFAAEIVQNHKPGFKKVSSE